jgi:hypothetical protein
MTVTNEKKLSKNVNMRPSFKSLITSKPVVKVEHQSDIIFVRYFFYGYKTERILDNIIICIYECVRLIN